MNPRNCRATLTNGDDVVLQDAWIYQLCPGEMEEDDQIIQLAATKHQDSVIFRDHFQSAQLNPQLWFLNYKKKSEFLRHLTVNFVIKIGIAPIMTSFNAAIYNNSLRYATVIWQRCRLI